VLKVLQPTVFQMVPLALQRKVTALQPLAAKQC